MIRRQLILCRDLPIEQVAANINVDGLNVWGPSRDIVLLGASALLLPSELGLLGATHRSRGLRREGGDGLGDLVFST